MKLRFLVISFLMLISSCDNPVEVYDPVIQDFNSSTRGAGFFDYTEYAPLDGKTIRVYYYIPESVAPNSDILFVFHGNSRNALDYRNAMIDKADEYNFIVIAPKFSNEDFPGSDKYALGNVFTDGDNPSQESLNPETEWTFSVIEPLFDYITNRLENVTNNYKLFGHSAGGQFAHRLFFFKPNTRIDELVVSAPGWYTTIVYNTSFPYGFKNSPLENASLNLLLTKPLHVIVGEEDNDPNASSLRRNPVVDEQGTNRLDRANYFYTTASEQSIEKGFPFNWTYETIPNVGHEFLETSKKAADILFK